MMNLDQLDRAVRRIVAREGGYRERTILRVDHDTEPDPDTWNQDHKVVHVTARTADEDGYRPGFAVDLVAGIICG